MVGQGLLFICANDMQMQIGGTLFSSVVFPSQKIEKTLKKKIWKQTEQHTNKTR